MFVIFFFYKSEYTASLLNTERQKDKTGHKYKNLQNEAKAVNVYEL